MEWTRRAFIKCSKMALFSVSLGSAPLFLRQAVHAAKNPIRQRIRRGVMDNFEFGELIYDNPLSSTSDIEGFRLEGDAAITFPNGRMRMENRRDPGEGQAANFVFWCPEDFPTDIAVTWDFWPVREPGLCILFFSALGRGGEDIFDPSLAPRAGEYKQYHSSDINALHVSYFRRKGTQRARFSSLQFAQELWFSHGLSGGGSPAFS